MKVNYRNGGKAKLYAALKAYAEGGQVDPPYKKGADGKYRDENGNEVSVKPEGTLSQADIEERGYTTLGEVAQAEWQDHPNYQKLWAAASWDFARTNGKAPDPKTNKKGWSEYNERLSNFFERRVADMYANNPNPDSQEVESHLLKYENILTDGMADNPSAVNQMNSLINKKYSGSSQYARKATDGPGTTYYQTNRAFTKPTPGDEGMPGSSVKLSGW